MSVSTSQDLSQWHTFGLPAQANHAVTVTSIEELKQALQLEQYRSLPKLILGGGSNVLFTESFTGLLIRNRIMGKRVESHDDNFELHIGAGEEWDPLVRWCLDQGIAGLENLGLIPGTMGAAPIQNIGAYGVELADYCSYVDYLDLELMTLIRVDAASCNFGYRDSIFKRELLGNAVICAVGLTIPKQWQPQLRYGPLQQLQQPTPQQIYDEVVAVRQSKLPDPDQLGNAGSFFKNPLISKQQYQLLQQQFGDIPGYGDDNAVKVPAGWLIDKCGLKGHQIGGAAVHQLQALVLVNIGNAVAEDVLALARLVIDSVEQRYGIELEPEVRILDSHGNKGFKR
ncbi:UDP-N-acetylmuramate dehydrogenase [Ferrimonas lipolytica]|uniref:UDP-N-acetylenolpyruvoylglucosamine reductase n=1 Tax=Ferrimonas lipolytica TaxID=2724191 RepID=A0A6H1UIV0_9GAMM|nr:UDP-N-acetylmuramate dehydrogenase [Ferrimonas lipolytica]